MYPIEGPFDIGKAGDNASVLGEHAIPNTLDQPAELSLWMSHEVHIDRCADADVLHLPLAIVCDDPPLASVDEREHWSARSSVCTHGDVHVGHIGIEGRDDAESLQVEPGGIDLCGQTGPLRLKNIQGVDNVNRLSQPCS